MKNSYREIPIASPLVGSEEIEEIANSVRSGWLTQGPKVLEFEKRFADLHGTNFALATTSCTSALYLILRSFGIGPGDEVIVPSFTWVATANVVVQCGATPVFADVDTGTFNIEPQKVKKLISEHTKAVIPVHLFGLCVDIDSLKKTLPSEVLIVEDAACAVGSSYANAPAGSLGDAAAFSFHPRKLITTGEGGMVTTDNEELAEKIRVMMNHGASVSEETRHAGNKPYILPEFKDLGFNFRMTDLQGSLGLVQLNRLEKIVAERRQLASYYNKFFENIDWIRTPSISEESEHTWQSYVLYIDPKKAPKSRDEIMEYLHGLGIATRPGTHAVHMLGFYVEKFGFKPSDFPNSRDCYENTLAIPMHNHMSKSDCEHVVYSLSSIET